MSKIKPFWSNQQFNSFNQGNQTMVIKTRDFASDAGLSLFSDFSSGVCDGNNHNSLQYAP